MITITRSHARQIRQVFRRALLGSSRGPMPPVTFRADSSELLIGARNSRAAVLYCASGGHDQQQFAVPFTLFTDCEGTPDDPVTLELESSGQVVATWSKRRVPQSVRYDSEAVVGFPDIPTDFGNNNSTLLDALRDTTATCDPAPERYALNCLQLRGTNGQIAATDGSQLLIQSGFDFPWDADLLLPGNAVFACEDLRSELLVQIGKTDDWLTLRTGPWVILLAIDKDARFPNVDDYVQKPDAATARMNLTQDDAEFAVDAIKRLPNEDEFGQPVTVDLNGSFAIRARAGDGTPPTEVVLRTVETISGGQLGTAA